MKQRKPMGRGAGQPASRAGAATLDYVLTLGALFTMSGVAVSMGGDIIKLSYEMINVLIAYPFM